MIRAVGVITIVEEVICIQLGIPEELESRSVPVIRAGLCYYVNVRAGITPVGCVICRSLNFKFLDSIRVWHGDADVDSAVVSASITCHALHGNTVHLEIVLARRAAIDAHIQRALAERGRVVYSNIGSGRQADNL